MAVSLATASAGNPRKGQLFGCSSEKAKKGFKKKSSCGQSIN